MAVLDSIVICDEINDQQAPSVSFGDSVFLVSWLDKRGTFPAIYAARITMDGVVIEDNGFVLHADSMNQISPVSAFDGNNFLVAWIGFDGGGFGVYAKRVSPEGSIIDSMPIEICYDATAKYNPAIAFNGNNYMVIWDDARLNGAEYDEWCARISPGGVLLDTNNIPVDTSSGYQYTPSLAYCAPYFLAVWTDDQSGNTDLVGKRIDGNGVVVDQIPISICSAAGGQLAASAYAGNDHYFVSWEDGRNGYENMDIYGVFVDSAGTGVVEDVTGSEDRGRELTAEPNPFSEKVVIRTVKRFEDERLCVRIFDVCGRMVKEYAAGSVPPRSRQTFVWDARDDRGHEVSAGIYFVAVGEGSAQETLLLLLIK